MTLYCVRDGDSANDAKGWNTPLKKVEKPAPVPSRKEQYISTPTPGVVIDSQTGKMETQIPENENANLLGGGAPHYLPKPVAIEEEFIFSHRRQYGKSNLKKIIDEYFKQAEQECGVDLGKHQSMTSVTIQKRSEDPQDFSSWYNSPEVQAFCARKNGRLLRS